MILPRAVLVGALLAAPALGQGLTCPKDQTASCIDRSTVCLDAMQCNSEGFACKSQVSTCARDLSILQGKFDTLVRDYNALKQLSDQTLRENDLLRRQLQDVEQRARALEDCMLFATSAEDVQSCR
ncbi:MAG TPA: hypothetical protein PK450_00265 [Paracoccaceae bacterium]|nr:hypothetical protein [Paracoccaceae bacterium]